MPSMLCCCHLWETFQMQVLPPEAMFSHASQEHLIRNESIVNQKQICLGGHGSQTVHYMVSQQGHSIWNAWPKMRDKSHHISNGFNITYHTVYALSLLFVRNSADTSSATSGTTSPCLSRTLNKEWVDSESKTDMFGWACTTNKSLSGFPTRSYHRDCSAIRWEMEVTTSVVNSTSPTTLWTMLTITFCVMRLSIDPLLCPVMARCKTVPAHFLYSVLLTVKNEENPSMELFPSSKCGKQGASCLFSGRQVKSSVFLICEKLSKMLMVPLDEGWPVFSNTNWGYLLSAGKGLMSNHNASHVHQSQQQNLTTPSIVSQLVACFWYSLGLKVSENHLSSLCCQIPAWHIHM